MTDIDWIADLTEILEKRGHSVEEIAKIIERVRQYDAKTARDSVMDSIADGTFNLDAIIHEALEGPGE